jgi:hypothetical protein
VTCYVTTTATTAARSGIRTARGGEWHPTTVHNILLWLGLVTE